MGTTARLLAGNLVDSRATKFIEDPASVWIGYPIEWEVTLEISAQTVSDPGANFAYTANDIEVGDWVAGSFGAIALKIIEIIEVPHSGQIKMVVQDEDQYNLLADPSQSGFNFLPNNKVVVFAVSESGLPVLGPILPYYLDANAQNDLIARFLHQGKLKAGGAGGNTLEEPSENAIDDGAVVDWVVDETTYTDAITDLNRLLGLLVPEKPPALSTMSMSVAGEVVERDGAFVLLATGAPAHVNHTLVPGDRIARINSLDVTTNDVVDFDSGTLGSLRATVNGTLNGSITLSDGDDAGTDGALTIVSDSAFPPETPGFWQALTAHVSATLEEGINSLGMNHSTTGTASPAIVLVDPEVLAPTINNVSTTVVTPGTAFYSSGIPHYTDGAKLGLSADVAGLASNAYLSDHSLRISTTPNIGSAVAGPGRNGIPAILNVDHAMIPVANLELTMTGNNLHAMSKVHLVAANAQADSDVMEMFYQILYAAGTPTEGVVEAGKSMSNAVLKRVVSTAGANPDDTYTSFAASTFNSGSSTVSGDASAPHEAVIRAGVLLQDATNYAEGFFPAGPNYSTKPAQQYATFMIKKPAASNMVITFTGADPAELYVKLPGLSNAMPNTTFGWWDAKKQADFAPGQWPGSVGASNGAMSVKTDLSYGITFGSTSSSNSTDNIVLIRVGLTQGQAITNIQVTL